MYCHQLSHNIASKTGLSLHPSNKFSTDRPKAVPLLQVLFVCETMVSYVAFVLTLSVTHLYFFWCPEKAVLRD